MTSRELIILVRPRPGGVGPPAVHELFGVATAWVRIDSRFPAGWRSRRRFAGACLLVVGAVVRADPGPGLTFTRGARTVLRTWVAGRATRS